MYEKNFLFAPMTKKSSKRTPSQFQGNIIGEEQKPYFAPKNTGSEIDQIFAGEKRKKSEVEKTEKLVEVTERTNKKKKKQQKIPSQLQEYTIGKEQKPSSAPKKTGSEIDEIFAGKKRKKSEVERTEKPDEVTERTSKKKKNDKKKTKGPDDDEFVDRPSRPRKRTEDGLSIYTEEELCINKGDAGSTPLCPFDCSCCF